MLFIVNELDHHLREQRVLPGNAEIILNNIALLESDEGEALRSNIIITLVNLEEESTLKNTSQYQRRADGRINLVQPPVWLNLYLLFSCNFPNNYTGALSVLGQIIQFFQTFPVLNGANPLSGVVENQDVVKEDLVNMKLTFELYTLTFEQINHLWGALGGKQVPSVLYKARMINIQDRRVFREGPMIEEIQATLNPITEDY
jgi:hypothetical protein